MSSELTPQDVLADLFGEEGFEIADATGAAQAAVQRLEDAGFSMFDERTAAAEVLLAVNRVTGNPVLERLRPGGVAGPAALDPAATATLELFVEGPVMSARLAERR